MHHSFAHHALLPLLCLGILTAGHLALAQNSPDVISEGGTIVLLTDPFLQHPTEDGVHVVWFTEWRGQQHLVHYGQKLDTQVPARSRKMSRMAEDEDSHLGKRRATLVSEDTTTPREIWRHEAHVTGLKPGERVPYRVESIYQSGTGVMSELFSLQPAPVPGQPLKILLTSDHQSQPLTAVNLEMVEKTVGMVDGVFFAGDLVNTPDRASEWFDDERGSAFFPCLQGKGAFTPPQTQHTYRGGALIQHAPLFPVVGNHEVMGRYDPSKNLQMQFEDAQPKEVAEQRYEQLSRRVTPDDSEDAARRWIEDNSYNTISYREIFSLPPSEPGAENYYGVRLGDIYLIGLYATRIWRTPEIESGEKGTYTEPHAALNNPEEWGYGEFIFADLQKGSTQYEWLADQLRSPEFRDSKYKIVMMHQAPHGFGINHVPVFAHPVQIIERDDSGSIASVRYEYPLDRDILFNDVMPLLKEAGVDLIHSGHSHLWFRINLDGVTYIETSHVGNSYGCYIDGYKERTNIPDDDRFDLRNYPRTGDPHGLSAAPPTLFSPLTDENGNALPCVDSNDLTVFTILDTHRGTLSSYAYNTREPESPPRLFDEVVIGR